MSELEKKIIITGAKGQLATEFIKTIRTKYSPLGGISSFYDDVQILEFDRETLDITNKDEVFKTLEEQKPFAVVNCAAYTDVDLCETEKEKAFKTNAIGPRNLALACENQKAILVHISTDYVFSGQEKEIKTEADLINPKSFYGRTKALGEEYVKKFCKRFFILRTSWLYGKVGKNFVKTIVKVAREKKQLKVVNDQFGSPTNVVDLSFLISKILTTKEYGIYHCSGEGECSWYEFAVEIVKQFKINAKVSPCSTEEFKRKAQRPKYSVLENLMLKTTIGNPFRHWRKALEEFANENINIL